MVKIRRGDIWLADLNPIRGREQAGTRPILIVSANPFNQGASDLVIQVPITRTYRNLATHIPLAEGEGGLTAICYAMCEQIRALSKERLKSHWGTVSSESMMAVADRLKLLLNIF
jgi:mRNA interferase MazF